MSDATNTTENVTTNDDTPSTVFTKNKARAAKADAKARKPRKASKPPLPKGASVVSLESLNQALASRHKVTAMKGKLFRDYVRKSLETTNSAFKGKRAMWSEGWRPTDADVKALDAMYAGRAARQAK